MCDQSTVCQLGAVSIKGIKENTERKERNSSFRQGSREYTADYLRKQRETQRDITIPEVGNPERRKRCLANVLEFLPTYFPGKFYDPFVPDQLEMIDAIRHRSQYGGDQAIAAPRAGGKTTITECVIIYGVLAGELKFPVIVGATGPDASRILSNIKEELEFNDLLHDDFPEVCHPIRALDGAVQRGKMQTVGGVRTSINWAADIAVLPTVKGSKASGAVLMTRGLDAAIRGINYRGRRPDLIVIDDPETRESSASDHQITIREQILERDIAGLGGPGRSIAKVMLCTIQNRKCLAFRYTDRSQKPSWNGHRHRLISRLPERQDLWEEYVRLRQTGMESGTDKDARQAQEFYVANREEMDRGAVLGNPNRYEKRLLLDGTQKEISALQHCYNIIGDRGWDAFATEYQNDPPADETEESGITATIVRSRQSKLPRGVLPESCVALTAAIDIGKRLCHYTVIAWLGGPVGIVVDYDVLETYGSDDVEVGTEKAIINALHDWRADKLAKPYCDADGEPRHLDRVLVDSGFWDTTIYRFVKDAGHPFMASKGFGQSTGIAAYRPAKASDDRKVGEHWHASRIKEWGLWLVGLDADYWKRWCHSRWLTPTFEGNAWKNGSLSLWGDSDREHLRYSQHIVAETEVTEFVENKGVKTFWRVHSKANHWLDSTYMACAASSLCGIKLLGAPAQTAPRRSNPQQGDDEKRPVKPRVQFLDRPGGWIQGMR